MFSQVTRVFQWFKTSCETFLSFMVPNKPKAPLFPEIDTSFLGDAGPLPALSRTHWDRHVNRLILINETYVNSDGKVVSYVSPVILLSLTPRGTLLLQRVQARESYSALGRVERVGPPYHSQCTDCQFIADLSQLVS